MDQRALRYWIGFNRIKGIGAARFHGLLNYFSDLETAWNASETDLLNAVADVRACNSILKTRQTADLDGDLAAVAHIGARVITLLDDEYPPLLRQIDNAPPVLYIKGTLKPDDARAIAVVGTRRATTYGQQVARNLTGELVQAGLTIISGLAKGIDSTAHQTALDHHGRTFAVLGHGIDQIYPAGNRALAAAIIEQGALITEYPIGTPPDGNNFPQRNRLISGLSLGVLVIEARPGSGALSTARHALDQGREVFAIPGSIYAPESRGTNLLIQTSEAKLVSRVEDITGEIYPEYAGALAHVSLIAPMEPPATPTTKPASQEQVTLTDVESLMMNTLSAEPVYVDELIEASGLPMVQVLSTLSILELRGLVQQFGPMRYALITQ